MDAKRKKLIDQIQKLLAMADSTRHSEEAETARNLAATLLAKYNIGEAELHQKRPAEFVIVEERPGRKSPDAT